MSNVLFLFRQVEQVEKTFVSKTNLIQISVFDASNSGFVWIKYLLTHNIERHNIYIVSQNSFLIVSSFRFLALEFFPIIEASNETLQWKLLHKEGFPLL